MSAVPKDYTGLPMTATEAVQGHKAVAARIDRAIENVAVGAADAFLAAIERMARDPAIDVNKVEQLFALKEREQQRQAERAFNAALRRCQMRMGAISANAQNPETRSKYADYYALDEEARPIYTEEGFSVTFSTADASTPEAIKILGWLLHDDGHSRQYEITMPADGKGAKGGSVMSKTHATGSAMTYGKRYLLADMFNLVIDKDDDGNRAGVNDAQVQAVCDLMKETKTDTVKFCEHFGIAMVADLSRKDYQRAMDYLRRKAGGSQKAPEYLES